MELSENRLHTIDRPFLEGAYWEKRMLTPEPFRPEKQKFISEMRSALYPDFKYFTGFKSWAQNLPTYQDSENKFPFSAAEYAYLIYSDLSGKIIDPGFKIFGSNGRVISGTPSLKPFLKDDNNNKKVEQFREFLKKKNKIISENFKEISVFGYPVVFCLSEKFWVLGSAAGVCYPFGLIVMKPGLSLDEVEKFLIHEFTHAMLNYPGRGLYNVSPKYNYKTRQSGNYYYGPGDLIIESDRSEVRRAYRNRILSIFREEIETYYNQGVSKVGHQNIQQLEFNSAFAQVENYDRDPGQFEQPRLIKQLLDTCAEIAPTLATLIQAEEKYDPPLDEISLEEIFKYDLEFAKEVDSTLRFWKLLLSKSSPVTIEKLIGYVQAANSFDQISVANLKQIRESIGVTTFC